MDLAYFRIELNISSCTGWNQNRSMPGLPSPICRNSSIYSLNYPGSILCVCIKAVRGMQSLEPMHKFDMAWQNTGSSGQHTAWSNLLIHFSMKFNTFLTYVMHNSDFNWWRCILMTCQLKMPAPVCPYLFDRIKYNTWTCLNQFSAPSMNTLQN